MGNVVELTTKLLALLTMRRLCDNLVFGIDAETRLT
jgi:hypothetical protein